VCVVLQYVQAASRESEEQILVFYGNDLYGIIGLMRNREIAQIFWGSETAGDYSTYDGKALAALKIQNRTYAKDCLGLCDFGFPITYSFSTPDHVGDPNLETDYFTAVTGMESEVMEKAVERAVNVQRAILILEGRKLPEDDYPLEYNFSEPLLIGARGQKVVLPGPNDEIVEATGNTLDRKKYTDMLGEYYGLRGWDKETGYIKEETLKNLDLEDLGMS